MQLLSTPRPSPLPGLAGATIHALALLAGVAGALAGAGPASAQTSRPGSSAIEEVVITARKREESLQSVPVSATVFDAEALRNKRIIDIESLEANTPGFVFDYLGGTKARPTIRGVGSDEPGAGGDPSTVVFLDGVYQGRQGAAAVDMFDIQQVDVLRGPQGTLWGKNAAGGAVNIVTNKPEDEFSGRLDLTGGTDAIVETLGVLNLPMNERVKSRFAVSYKDNDGFVENLFTGNDVYDTNRISARAHLLFEPTDGVDLLLTADYTRDDTTGLPAIVTRSNGGADTAVDANGPFETQADKDGFAEREMYGLRGELNIDFGFATLTNITAFRSLEDETDEDWDGTNPVDFPTVPQISFGFGDDAESLSSETRLAGTTRGIDWVGGVYYLHENTDAFASLGLNAAQFDWTSTNETDSYAFFGELDIPVTDRLNLSGGARYTREEKDYRNVLVAGGAAQLFDTDQVVQSTPGTDTNPTFDETTWRVSLDYQLMDGVFLYALASTGFKSGAFDSLAFDGTQAATPLLPEEVDNYEVGVKTTLPGGFGSLNVTGFHMDYQNLQLVQFTGIGATGGVNLPSADINGIELDAQLTALPSTVLDIGYTYLDTDAESPEPDGMGGTVIVDGRRLVRSAKHDFSASLLHELALAGGGRLDFGANVSHRSKVFDDPDNNDLEVRPARTLLDGFVTWTTPDAGWRLTLWAKNITDEDYVIRVSNIANFNQVVVGPPRRVGVTVSANFD